jgi:LAGLIDADG DNA endonuclease family
MDDGSLNKTKGNLVLCTDSYSKEDVLYLISILESKFNLSCGLIEYKKNRSYRIRINKSSIPHLIQLTKPYIISSMYYKLGL